MTELTREQIEPILDEADDEGIPALLAKYGRGESTKYWVKSPYRGMEKSYPSKAVASAAIGHELNGGYQKHDSACNVLERAGYIIVDSEDDHVVRPTTSLPPLWQYEIATKNIDTTEALAEVKVRIGQTIFRRELVKYWGSSCAASGLTDLPLLRASHIKPWRKCDSDAERLNPFNGLLLSALWDAAFDAGLVTFEDDGQPVKSSLLSDEACIALDFEKTTPLWVQPAHAEYLEWHRNNIFEKG